MFGTWRAFSQHNHQSACFCAGGKLEGKLYTHMLTNDSVYEQQLSTPRTPPLKNVKREMTITKCLIWF